MKTNVSKITIASVLTAVAVVGSLISFPFLGSKCAPIQHIVNVIIGITLGPWYALGSAFIASLLRNLMGIGSLLAFPGSMFGAFLCGFLYRKYKHTILAILGELFGTAVLGGLSAYPIAIILMGQDAVAIAFYAYVIPFLISTGVGSVASAFIVIPLLKMSVVKNYLKGNKSSA